MDIGERVARILSSGNRGRPEPSRLQRFVEIGYGISILALAAIVAFFVFSGPLF